LPLPLHARAFLQKLPALVGANAVAVALKPLLNRVATVSRLRRAALVAGCIALPVLACGGGYFGLAFLQELTRKNPGLMDLNVLLQMRTSARFFAGKHANLPTDRQIAVYIAQHYRGTITNEAKWSGPYALAMIRGEARKFAEQSVAEHPAPTEAEIKEADAAVGKRMPEGQSPFVGKPPPAMPVLVLGVALLFYVAFPALVAALLFRGGLVLLIGGVTYVSRDGARASRLRLLWRALVAWGPVLPLFMVAVLAFAKQLTWQPWLALALLGMLAVVSVALPQRGLQDRLAGTWPVPR